MSFRPKCNWGSGDLPAPYAEGDLVRLVGHGDDDFHRRMRDVPVVVGALYEVVGAFSIGEGDEWYFRVSQEGSNEYAGVSDRLHVGVGPVDYMDPFILEHTTDPEGLARRLELLADGWTPPPPPERCPTCGRIELRRGDS